MALRLESFDDPRAASRMSEPAEPEGPGEDWRAGHAQGLAEGEARARAAREAEEAALSQALVTALEEAAWTYAEARAAVLGSLRPLLDAMMTRVLPEAAALSLVPRLLDVVEAAAATDSRAPVVIHVAPGLVTTVRAALPLGAPATVVADAAMGPGAARLSLGEAETLLDPEACLGAVAEALAALWPSPATPPLPSLRA